MRLLKQSTARTILILMVDSADHITGLPGLTLTFTASKNGGVFASITPTYTSRGNGLYAVDLTTSHTDTAGDLVIHVTAPGADDHDEFCDVRTGLPGETVAVDSIAAGAITSATFAAGAIDANAMATDAIGALELAAGAVTEIAAGLPTAGNIADSVWDEDRSAHQTAGSMGAAQSRTRRV